MSQLQIFGLIAPFYLLAVCAGLSWWSHREAVRMDLQPVRQRATRRK